MNKIDTYQFRWIPKSQTHVTRQGTKYRLGFFHNGMQCILLPFYQDYDKTVKWYAPTEQKIFETNDTEFINLYKEIDNFNNEKMKNKNEV